jgi:hypothetical protein
MTLATAPVGEASALTAFQWTPQPQAERFVLGVVETLLSRCPAAQRLAARMKDETGTRFHDWIDHIWLPATSENEARVKEAGYVPVADEEPLRIFRQPDGMFPAIGLCEGAADILVGIKVESVADFAAANGLLYHEGPSFIEGLPLSPFRRLNITEPNEHPALVAVERHGFPGFVRPAENFDVKFWMLRHAEIFRLRRRDFGQVSDADEQAFEHAVARIDKSIRDLGVDLTCDIFFAAEREYWQRRNRAAQAQKARQDRLGLGWANHDHHTYRSSRRHFARLIGLFEKLGFHCRERFYAGKQAGWGAQVLEQPNTGVVIFADVDLSPDELLIDFAHDPLPPPAASTQGERDTLGTVGLWCALHGESLLQAGMHHLECQFDFEGLRDQLERAAGVRMMKPFTDFPYLRQAFTEGERWPVEPFRIDRLLKAGMITAEQADKFRSEGAIGSHLENLERNQGFKGFNQTGVSEIIAATDPRKHLIY